MAILFHHRVANMCLIKKNMHIKAAAISQPPLA
jgi:hypothetical protein